MRVTEIRALLDLGADGRRARPTDEQPLPGRRQPRASSPTERVSGAVGFGASTDETVAAGLVRRDYHERHALARLTVDLARDLDLQPGLPLERLREPAPAGPAADGEPVQRHPELEPPAHRGRDPAPSAAGTSRRKATLLQSQDSIRLGVALQLLTDLRLRHATSTSRGSRIPSRGATATAGPGARPWRCAPSRWSVSGGFTYARNETLEGEPLLNRTQYRALDHLERHLLPDAGRHLVVHQRRAGGARSTRATTCPTRPGDRLTISATYQGYDGSGGSGPRTDSLSVTYRLFTRFHLFANLSRSRTRGRPRARPSGCPTCEPASGSRSRTEQT